MTRCKTSTMADSWVSSRLVSSFASDVSLQASLRVSVSAVHRLERSYAPSAAATASIRFEESERWASSA